MSLRLVFMGTPDFAAQALADIVATSHEVVAVYARPPAKAGRGMALTPCPVHKLAAAHGLHVETPPSLKDAAVQASFEAHRADLVVVAAYGMILPQAYLDAPRLGCWNIHASLLPRWRGAAPIQRAIMAGDTQTGISIMQMDAGLDTGDVLHSVACPISDDDTAASLHDKLAALGGPAVLATLDKIDAMAPRKQPQDGVTYAEKIDKAEARIDWHLSAAEVHNHIRGLSPFPGAWTEIAGARVKILAAIPAKLGAAAAPGTVLDGQLTIACGADAVRLTRVQKAGKAAMDTADYLRGTEVAPGTVL